VDFDAMDFDAMDPEAALESLQADPALFSRAVVTLVACENYDNHRPRGLDAFLAFFDRHRVAIHAGTLTGADLHAEYLRWLRHQREA